MSLIFGIAVGIFLAVAWPLVSSLLPFRPGPEWKPDSNVDWGDRYKIAAYKAAAKKLGVRMKLAQPVPCAGIAMCGGMYGVWLHRDDARKLKPHQFTSEMWNEYSRITE